MVPRYTGAQRQRHLLFERTNDNMEILFAHRSVRLTALVLVLVGMVWLVLARAATVQAGGTVGTGMPASCNEAALDSALLGGGSVSFNCGAAPVTITVGSTKVILANTTINGGGKVTLSGGGSQRLFMVNSGVALALNNITISDGFSNSDGGAIVNNGVLSIDQSRLLNNHTAMTGSGGAIVSYGTLTITNSTMAYNSAANGGALFPRFAPARTLIVNSVLHDNSTTSPSVGWGGALLAWDGALVTIDHSTLYSNTARTGGALYVYPNSVLTLTNSTLSGNPASGSGGGIYNGGTATLNDSTLSGNPASASGGGIYNDTASTATLNNSTLSGNSAY